MAQFSRPSLVAAIDDGITLSTKANGAWEALYTNHAGAAPPPDPEKGQVWVDISEEAGSPNRHELKIYTGSVWRLMGTLNLTTGAYSVAGNLPLAGGTVTGPILFPAGTAAAPAVTFDADTNTGIYRIGADRLGFSTNGVIRMEINAAGQIGMNNVAVDPFRLYVAQAAADAVVASRNRFINLNTANDASVNLEFATASGALRGAVRGQREGGTNHGRLILSSALSGAQVDVLTLASDGDVYPFNQIKLNNDKPIYFGGVASIQRQAAGHVIFNRDTNYRDWWSATDGAWRWQGGTSYGTTLMTLNAAGTLVVGIIYSPLLRGGPNDAGHLNCWGSSGQVNFRWHGGISGLAQRVNEALEERICTAVNAGNLGYVGGSGGPTGIALNGQAFDGTLFGIFVDAISDERIKDNIRNTDHDALDTVMSVPVRAFDVKGEVAAWQRSVGLTPEQRAEALLNAEPVPVPIGFVTQELQAKVPEAVRVPPVGHKQPEGSPLPDDVQTYSPETLVPYLWRAIQQQQEIIDTLTARVASLEGKT
jgi:hypothetical protein